uniref:scavenger receptor class F member 2-like isoform X2 n=1 Tax=Myxine glutinosa TaxID=7769 RepID=UPI00358E8B40
MSVPDRGWESCTAVLAGKSLTENAPSVRNFNIPSSHQAVCAGEQKCSILQSCVRPGECRCRHGYYGTNCDVECPPKYWGRECRLVCLCHPYGRCHQTTGRCTCLEGRWGPACENRCPCHSGSSTCDPQTGKCHCLPGWWGNRCGNRCVCGAGARRCHPDTGRCECEVGWWGTRCESRCTCRSVLGCEQLTGRCLCGQRRWGRLCQFRCLCEEGRCDTTTGVCVCPPGYRGRFCKSTCPAGLYGPKCSLRCGWCQEGKACETTSGLCESCAPGWNGSRCDVPCPDGWHGTGCLQACPTCRGNASCRAHDGTCAHCPSGQSGARCELACPTGRWGEGCATVCPPCHNGTCDLLTGGCHCLSGYWGTSCNETCPPERWGVGCEGVCYCGDVRCDPSTGTCLLRQHERMGLIGVGILAFLLLTALIITLALPFSFHGCQHWIQEQVQGAMDNGRNTRAQSASGRSWNPRVRVQGPFSQLNCKLHRPPVTQASRSSYPPAATLNTPSADAAPPTYSWTSVDSFSSFDTDDGPVYCIPEGGLLEIQQPNPDETSPGAATYTCLMESTMQQPSTVSAGSQQCSSYQTPVPGYSEPVLEVLKSNPESSVLDQDPQPSNSTLFVAEPIASPNEGTRPKPRPPDPATKPKRSLPQGEQDGVGSKKDIPPVSMGNGGHSTNPSHSFAKHSQKRNSSQKVGRVKPPRYFNRPFGHLPSEKPTDPRNPSLPKSSNLQKLLPSPLPEKEVIESGKDQSDIESKSPARVALMPVHMRSEPQ